MTMAQCPDCQRWVGTYAVKGRPGRTGSKPHHRFDIHQARYSTGNDCPMSDEPVPQPPVTGDTP